MLCLQSRCCGFILISRGLSSCFIVAAMLLPPRVLWGGEQRAQQREKQIPQHFTMWVRLRHLWQSISARLWHPMLSFMAETEGKPMLPLPSSTDDHSRVVLSHDGHPCSDYINASYINVKVHYASSFSGKLAKYWYLLVYFYLQGFKEKNRFIAAQGKIQASADWIGFLWYINASVSFQAQSSRQWLTFGAWFGNRRQRL